jgi:ATP-dependent Zn protease
MSSRKEEKARRRLARSQARPRDASELLGLVDVNDPGFVAFHEAGHDVNDPRFVAFHEAGHAVSAVILGFNLKSVDVKQRKLPGRGVSLGFTDSGRIHVDEVDGKCEAAAMRYLIQCMSGPSAESLVNKDAFRFGAHLDDLASVHRVAAAAICGTTTRPDGRREVTSEAGVLHKGRINALLSAADEAATRMIEEHVPAITRVAELLMERQSLTGDEVRAIVRDCAKHND